MPVANYSKKNAISLYEQSQSPPVGLRKIFIDYFFFQADQWDCTKSSSIVNRFASSEQPERAKFVASQFPTRSLGWLVNYGRRFVSKLGHDICAVFSHGYLQSFLLHDIHGFFCHVYWRSFLLCGVFIPKYNYDRASDRVRQKMGNSAAFSREIMQQERSIMRQIMRFF